MIYLLDSNICIDHLRKKGTGALRRKLESIDPAEISVCSVVKAELLEGAYRSRDPEKNLLETRELLRLFDSYPFDDAVAEHAGQIGAQLTLGGEKIGEADLLIAATAVAHNLILVTHNVREFSRVKGLRIEDWQAS